MEIGSYIELDLRNTGEYYPQNTDIIRLNTARAGIYHAIKVLGLTKVYIPYYLCSVVRDFLSARGLQVIYYSINENLEPDIAQNEIDTAFLLINYFGILTSKTIIKHTNHFHNVIIDNSQGFFSSPIEHCLNVYSPRKFFGVPDGCYVIGNNANLYSNLYSQDISSETSLFLLKRIEMGSQKAYEDRMKNENRLSRADVLIMSHLTKTLLKSIDYESIKNKRVNNFSYAHEKLRGLNKIKLNLTMDYQLFPMVYPLIIENESLVEQLKSHGIYTGRWWSHVLRQVHPDSYEAYLSKYLIPIPIDQRYGPDEIDYIHKHIMRYVE